MTKKIIILVVACIVFTALVITGIFGLYKMHLSKANKLYEAGQYEDAILEYKKAARFAGKNTQLYHSLARSYVKAGRYDDAILIYETIITLDPEDLKAYKMLGAIKGFKAVFQDDEEALKQAYELLKKAYESAPQDFSETDKKVMGDIEKELK